MSAAELMARVGRRDAAAFEEIYHSYYEFVFGLARRILGDKHSAEDVAQSVFLTVWGSPESYTTGNLGGWINRMTRNRAIDLLRYRSRHLEQEVPLDLPFDGLTDELARAQIDGKRVRVALALLPRPQRESIKLGFFEGVTHEEIARNEDIPLGTVKTRIRTGLLKLRSSLGARC